MKTLLKNRELSAFFAIVALFVVLVALNPAYFSLQTLAMIFSSSQILCLLALGATLVMLTRNIDVSVGSTVGLCAIAVGVALNNGYGLATAIAFALAIGALAGAFNGLLVVGLRIPAIVATLGTLESVVGSAGSIKKTSISAPVSLRKCRRACIQMELLTLTTE